VPPRAARELKVSIAIQGLASRDPERAEPAELPQRRARGVTREGPIVSGMAGRYATALFELALAQGAIDQVRGDLDRFDALMAESPDLVRLVRSPVFSAEEQVKALTAVLGQAEIGGLSANFLKVVASNRRLFSVEPMIRAYRALVAAHKGEVTAEVTFAEQPGERQLDAVREALAAVTRRDVQVDVKVNPAIIGGLIVKVGSRMVDGSLRAKLNSIKHAMKEVS
jgi:F-type H+-transporting ATPase subunit delta